MSEENLWEQRFLSLAEVTGATQDQLRQSFEEAPSPGKTRLKGWLDPAGNNFFGSGMNLQEFVLAGQIGRIRLSFSNQERREQKRRLDLIIRASHALEGIRKVSLQATAYAERAIEAIITGETDPLKMENMFDLCFPEDQPEYRAQFEALWEPFLKVIEEARETWP
ncbi:MAG: hypothetical protein GF334_11160 [Candidatus Altiarchaeales archaeon]|nr:hypothetical protein [Candidatus Altiarchaeales archaeon]